MVRITTFPQVVVCTLQRVTGGGYVTGSGSASSSSSPTKTSPHSPTQSIPEVLSHTHPAHMLHSVHSIAGGELKSKGYMHYPLKLTETS